MISKSKISFFQLVKNNLIYVLSKSYNLVYSIFFLKNIALKSRITCLLLSLSFGNFLNKLSISFLSQKKKLKTENQKPKQHVKK